MSAQIKPEEQVDVPVKIKESLGSGGSKRHYVVYQILRTCTSKSRPCVRIETPVSTYTSLTPTPALPSQACCLLVTEWGESVPSGSYSINHHPLLGFGQLQSLYAVRDYKINHNHLDMYKTL